MVLKILQWNVFVKEDPDKVAAEIKRIGADIICAQELIQILSRQPSLDTAKYIAQKIGYHYVFQPADTWGNRLEKETQGNAIFSKYPILNSSFQYLQPAKHNPPDSEHEGRVYLESRIAINNIELSIATTHLSYSDRFNITNHRKKEVDNLLAILKKKKKRYVFTGDLNAIPESYPVNEILKINTLKSSGPDFSENTWTTKPYIRKGIKIDQIGWRLDYIFLTQDLNVKGTRIIKTTVSDHLPILLEIAL